MTQVHPLSQPGYLPAPDDLPRQARTLAGGPPPSDAPLTITGAPAPVLPIPETPPMPSTWGPPPPGGTPVRRPDAWNWAAGAVLGLAVLAAVVGLPAFAAAVKFDQISDAATEDWLLWAAGGVGVICAVALGTRIRQLVSLLCAVCALLGIVGIAMAQSTWDVGSPDSWSSAAFIAGFAILGGCGAIGLKRS